MSGVNLKLLHTFMLAAEHGSFRKAAEIGGRSPSAISMQIKDLESQIGLNLFIRTPQRVILTPEGKILFNQIRSGMDRIQDGLDRISGLSAARQTNIAIACAPTLAASRLRQILPRFKSRHPKIHLTIKETPPREALDLLRNQEVEFYVGPEASNMSDFDFQFIAVDRIVTCVPPRFDHNEKSISIYHIKEHPIILLDEATESRSLVDEMVSALGIKMNVQYEVQTAITALSLASAGLGIAIVPNIAIGTTNQSGFRVVPISEKEARRSVGIITARGYVRRRYSEALIKLIHENLRTMA